MKRQPLRAHFPLVPRYKVARERYEKRRSIDSIIYEIAGIEHHVPFVTEKTLGIEFCESEIHLQAMTDEHRKNTEAS